MKKTDKTAKKVKFALNVTAPVAEIVGFVLLYKKSVKQAADAEYAKDTRKLPKWAIVLNILLRLVLIAAYIDEYKKEMSKDPIENTDCEFWNFCEEDCEECAYYKNAMKHSSDVADGCVDCAGDCDECNCTNTDCVIKCSDLERCKCNE